MSRAPITRLSPMAERWYTREDNVSFLPSRHRRNDRRRNCLLRILWLCTRPLRRTVIYTAGPWKSRNPQNRRAVKFISLGFSTLLVGRSRFTFSLRNRLQYSKIIYTRYINVRFNVTINVTILSNDRKRKKNKKRSDKCRLGRTNINRN